MGKVVEKKKKKKGRPSLLDLQKRSLKEQSQSQDTGNSATKQLQNHRTSITTQLRRSARRNGDASSPDERDREDSSPGQRRREKKLKLVLGLQDSSSCAPGGSDTGAEEDGDAVQNKKKRKITAIGDGSGAGLSSEKGDKPTIFASTHEGAQLDSEVSTPLPEKKLLLFILDRLQKKDTYGVFSEPVDPEELPDYHDIIEHPMDFGTVRKKLDGGAYANLEQFENDVFLICSNAMQYNAPDTVYFRQARSMQELARKNFDNLRQDSDNNELEQKVVRRGRPPTKHLKRPPGRPPLDCAASSDAALAAGRENTMSANFDMRNGSFSADKSNLMNPSSLLENRFERNDYYAGSLSKGNLMKLGKKQIVPDENRRNTYGQYLHSTSGSKPSLMATFAQERKLLLPVGLLPDHTYARSLARFAANLGPISWKVASEMIERSLPAGVKFGPGWVGENDILPPRRFQLSLSPLSSFWPFSLPRSSGSKDTHHSATELKDNPVEKLEGEYSNPLEKHPPLVPSSVPLPPPLENPHQPITKETEAGEGSRLTRPPPQIYSNGFMSPFRYNNNLAASHTGKMIGAKPPSGFHFRPPGSHEAEHTTCTNSFHCGPTNSVDRADANTSQNNSGLGRTLLPGQKPDQQRPEPVPPDLSIRFHTPRYSNPARAGSAQPDLALQL